MKTKTGSRNREHGVIDDSSVRLVGMDPRLAVREKRVVGQSLSFLLCPQSIPQFLRDPIS
jgi:hypothetical protein